MLQSTAIYCALLLVSSDHFSTSGEIIAGDSSGSSDCGFRSQSEDSCCIGSSLPSAFADLKVVVPPVPYIDKDCKLSATEFVISEVVNSSQQTVCQLESTD